MGKLTSVGAHGRKLMILLSEGSEGFPEAGTGEGCGHLRRHFLADKGKGGAFGVEERT